MENIDQQLRWQQANIDRVNAEIERLGANDVLIAIDCKGYLALVPQYINDPHISLVSEQSLEQIKLLPDCYLKGKLSEKKATTFWNAIDTIDRNDINSTNIKPSIQ